MSSLTFSWKFSKQRATDMWCTGFMFIFYLFCASVIGLKAVNSGGLCLDSSRRTGLFYALGEEVFIKVTHKLIMKCCGFFKSLLWLLENVTPTFKQVAQLIQIPWRFFESNLVQEFLSELCKWCRGCDDHTYSHRNIWLKGLDCSKAF